MVLGRHLAAAVVLLAFSFGASTACSDAAGGGAGAPPPPAVGPDGGVRPDEAQASDAQAADPRVRRSRPSYADNESGVIGAARLGTWLASWPSSRPPGITGDLVILQIDEAPGESPFVRGGPAVRVHHAPEMTRLFEPRNNGVAAIGRVPGNGVRIDSFMRRFAIRPNVDFVLFASAAPKLEDLARAWLVFRYWGVSPESLGILDGTVSALDPALRAATSEAHPLTERGRVVGLPNDGFWYLADVGAVRDALGRDVLVDTRSAAEFSGDALTPTPLDDTCIKGAPSCTASVSGRIAGATRFDVGRVADEGARFRSPAEIDTALRDAGLGGPRVHVVYDNDGRTSAVLAFALLAIAGVPGRWYASSFLEWASLNATHPVEGARTLPTTSPWRTDGSPSRVEGTTRWAPAELAIRPLVFDAASSAADRIQTADTDYKRAAPPLPAVGASDDVCR